MIPGVPSIHGADSIHEVPTIPEDDTTRGAATTLVGATIRAARRTPVVLEIGEALPISVASMPSEQVSMTAPG